MWSDIAQLPSEVIGVNVFSFLNVVDLVRLESAAVHRTELDKAFKGTSLRVPSLRTEEQQMRGWTWCVKRRLSIAEFAFEGEVRNGALLGEVVRLVPQNGIVRWHCIVGWGNTYASIKASGVLQRLTHLRLSGWPLDIHLFELCSSMTSLEEADVSGNNFLLQNLLLSCRPLRSLVISHVLPNRLLSIALFKHVSTLETFAASHSAHHEDTYEAIANMPNLRTLRLHGPAKVDGQNAATVEEQLVAIARGCTKLQTVTLSGAVTDATLHAFGEHCPGLEYVDLTACPSIPEAAALHLVQRCHNLTDIRLPDTVSTQAKQRVTDGVKQTRTTKGVARANEHSGSLCK